MALLIRRIGGSSPKDMHSINSNFDNINLELRKTQGSGDYAKELSALEARILALEKGGGVTPTPTNDVFTKYGVFSTPNYWLTGMTIDQATGGVKPDGANMTLITNTIFRVEENVTYALKNNNTEFKIWIHALGSSTQNISNLGGYKTGASNTITFPSGTYNIRVLVRRVTDTTILTQNDAMLCKFELIKQ